MKRYFTLAAVLALWLTTTQLLAQQTASITIYESSDGFIQDTVIVIENINPDQKWEQDLALVEGILPDDLIANVRWPEKRDEGELSTYDIQDKPGHQQEEIVIENINYSTEWDNSDHAEGWRDIGNEKANVEWKQIQRHLATLGERDSEEGKKFISILKIELAEKHDAGEPVGQTYPLIFGKVQLKDLSAPEAKSLQVARENDLHIEGLNVFPNPTQGRLTVSFNSPRTGKTALDVFSVTGQRIHHEELGQFTGEYQGQVDISNHEPGIYFLTITQDGQTLSQKLILTK